MVYCFCALLNYSVITPFVEIYVLLYEIVVINNISKLLENINRERVRVRERDGERERERDASGRCISWFKPILVDLSVVSVAGKSVQKHHQIDVGQALQRCHKISRPLKGK
jgi:hypothetical protein